jgi:hypothetical protein
MKWHKYLVIVTLGFFTLVGIVTFRSETLDRSHPPLPESTPEEAESARDEVFRIRVRTRQEPMGQWLTLVPWEDLKDADHFDDVRPFAEMKRVLIIKDGKCAVINRQAWSDRTNPNPRADE